MTIFDKTSLPLQKMMQLLQFFAGIFRCGNLKCDLHLLFNKFTVDEKVAISIRAPLNE